MPACQVDIPGSSKRPQRNMEIPSESPPMSSYSSHHRPPRISILHQRRIWSSSSKSATTLSTQATEAYQARQTLFDTAKSPRGLHRLSALETSVPKRLLSFARIAEHGRGEKGVDLHRWTHWLGLDLAAALTYGADLGQMQEMKDSPVMLEVLKCNLLVLMERITTKPPLLTPLKFLCIPPSTIFLIPKLLKIHSQNVRHRIETHAPDANAAHKDYLDQLLSTYQLKVPSTTTGSDQSNTLGPASLLTDPKQLLHVENISSQLLLATWPPLTNQFYSLILFLLTYPQTLEILTQEIRTTFPTCHSITLETVTSLKYLSACVSESLRLAPETTDGLPRISPGNVPIDGQHIPQGTICQISYFAAQRHPSYFTDGTQFRPERWLPPTHPLYDDRYKDDNLTASKPFSQGPRG